MAFNNAQCDICGKNMIENANLHMSEKDIIKIGQLNNFRCQDINSYIYLFLHLKALLNVSTV